ncbi:unnamed protein product [Caenorhabditis brenneri]
MILWQDSLSTPKKDPEDPKPSGKKSDSKVLLLLFILVFIMVLIMGVLTVYLCYWDSCIKDDSGSCTTTPQTTPIPCYNSKEILEIRVNNAVIPCLQPTNPPVNFRNQQIPDDVKGTTGSSFK